MKKLMIAAVVLMMCTVSYGITAGPGGRLYFTERTQDEFGDYYIHLMSYEIDTNWDVVGAQSPNDHGLILDNSDGNLNMKDNWGISPEIETYAGSGFGAKIVVGANYNQTPTSLYSGYEVMDLLRVTTSDGGHLVQVLGTGRVGHAAWYSSNDNFGHTDRGVYGGVDPAGGFLNAGEFLVQGSDYRRYLSVVTDSNSDGDVTDSDEDYLNFTTNALGFEEDAEFVGNKLWIANSYNNPAGDGIWYYERQLDGTISNAVRFVQNDPARLEFGQNGLSIYGYAMVADVIDGHDAVWVVNQAQNWINGVQSAYADLLFFIDLNDDGDAMDAGEATIIFQNADASGSVNDPMSGWTDMELVEHNGSKFLMVQNTTNTWNVGRRVFVLELLDNGDYKGGDESFHLIYATDLGGEGGDWEIGTEIEFDSVIPEPGTWLLFGTGIIGLFGYIQRRRMK